MRTKSADSIRAHSARYLPAGPNGYTNTQGFLHFQDFNKKLGLGVGFWVNKWRAPCARTGVRRAHGETEMAA